MSLRSAVRSRLLRAACSGAVVALLAVPALPAAAADEVEPAAPADPSQSAQPTQPPQPGDVVAVPAGPACTGGALGEGASAGASNPADGTRWVATVTGPGRLLLSRAAAGGTPTAPLATLDLPGAPGSAGGMTFGADGRLYVVAAADAGGEAVLYRTTLPLRPTATPLVATELLRTRTVAPVTRIAFSRDGLLHLVHDGSSTAVDPVSGDAVGTYDGAAGQALACGRPSQLTVRVALPEGRVAPADQLAVTLTGAAYDGSPTAPRGVTVGTDPGRQAQLGEYLQVLALPGAGYGLALTTADGTEPAAYDVTLACLDGTRTLLDQAATTAALTMPPRAATVTCTFAALPAEPEPEPEPEPEGDPRIEPYRTGPAVLALGRDGLLGGGVGTDRDLEEKPRPDRPERDRDQTRDTSGEDLGRDLGAQMRQDGGLGGGLGGGLPDATDTGDGADDADDQPEQTAGSRGPGPNLPNTGGPPAVVLPVALGAIVLGSVLVSRRRRRV